MYAALVPGLIGTIAYKTDVCLPAILLKLLSTRVMELTVLARLIFPRFSCSVYLVLTSICGLQGKFDLRGKRRGDTIAEW